MWLSGIIMTIGGHYSYEHVPLFDTLKETFHWNRNHLDRFGHIVQGVVVVLLVREVLTRFLVVTKQKWLFVIAILVSLANSAIYEILEFAAAAIMGKSPDEMLGAQGDIWDAQWDMLCAFGGACAGLLLFWKYHARKMRE
jgi:putative membrane protein